MYGDVHSATKIKTGRREYELVDSRQQHGEVRKRHPEGHLAERAGWLRAAVLGADDGLVSVSSIMVGVAASGAGLAPILTAGAAGLMAGAMSMAAGEYVSVSAQKDVELADRLREQAEQEEDPEGELRELAAIYQSRGLSRDLAEQVAVALHAAGPLEAHLRDEIGQTSDTAARPMQAALASASSFFIGGLVPFLGMLAGTTLSRIIVIVCVTLIGLVVSGVLSGRLSGTPPMKPALRLFLGGGAAMLITGLVGQLVHQISL